MRRDYGRDGPHKQQSENVLPKEKIIVYKEFNKSFALCINGNLSSLKLVLANLDKYLDNPVEEYYYAYLNQLLQWTLFADTLVLASEEGSRVVDQVTDHILRVAKREYEKGNEGANKSCLVSVWMILIIGWHIYVRTSLR